MLRQERTVTSTGFFQIIVPQRSVRPFQYVGKPGFITQRRSQDLALLRASSWFGSGGDVGHPSAPGGGLSAAQLAYFVLLSES